MEPDSLWTQFGQPILAHPKVTLAAHLGARWAVDHAHATGLAVPTTAAFLVDPAYDPNPHQLTLPEDQVETDFLVRRLAAWGFIPLLRAAVVCSAIQLERRSPQADDCAQLRLWAAEAASAVLIAPSAATQAEARRVADLCSAKYAPFDDGPDSDKATELWHRLGACWFAAETAAQDYSLSLWDGPGPALRSSSWGTRNSVWPQRAADAAAQISSHAFVRERIVSDITTWCREEVKQ